MLTRTFFLASVSVVVLLACATPPETSTAINCASPRFTASPLMVGDGARDRGFPGGVSLVDADNDGDLDLMATGGYSPVARQERPYYIYRPNVLYLNDGAGNFTHSSEAAFETADSPFSGSTWADIDNDGDLDAFVSTQHGRPDVFYRNQGGGHFAREELGDATTTAGSNFTSSWVDIDGDSDLDLVSGGPTLEMSAPLLLYRNDAGAFTRVTGIPLENGVSNPGAVLWNDYDNDGDVDLFVTNSDIVRRSNLTPLGEIETPQLYRNDGAWQFTRTEGQAFSADLTGTSAAAGDIDNDGDLDLYIAQFIGLDTIFLNDGTGRFTRDARFAGFSHEQWATAATFADVDLDGDVDLISVRYEDGIRLYLNDGAGAFQLVEDPALVGRVRTYSGLASGDIDNDGDLDLISGNWGETAEGDYITILRNESTLCGQPLRIELRSAAGAPNPPGARVTFITRGPAGERRQLREANAQTSFRSQSASAFLFGVPRAERLVRAEIRWPDGRTQNVTRLRAAQLNSFEDD